MEWVLLGIVLLAVVIAAWYFTTGSDTTPHNGTAAEPVGAIIANSP